MKSASMGDLVVSTAGETFLLQRYSAVAVDGTPADADLSGYCGREDAQEAACELCSTERAVRFADITGRLTLVGC
jgi:hypothetical protein